MNYPDHFNMPGDTNIRFARQNFTNLVHTNSRFEGINTTLPQTQTIMDGLGVDGISIDDINTIVDLKRGWQYVTESKMPFSLDYEKQLNTIVADKDALIPGQIRSGQGGVNIGSDEQFTPPLVSEEKEKQYLEALMTATRSTTDKALTIMYHNMRQQIFWDGNKRTATLAANKVMIDGGAGLINVPLDKWGIWNTLLSDYYRTGDMQSIKDWTYDYGVQGVNLV